MPNFRSMAAFAEVIEAGTFTAAAKRLGVAKSAVSKQISDLEQELGTVLLHRTTRRVTPTEAGIRYYEGCIRMVAAAEEAEKTVRDLRANPSGLLRLSAPEGLGTDHVVPAVSRFAMAYPNLRVEVNLEDRYVNLVEEGIDLAIRAGTLADSSLVAKRLAPVTSVICGSPAYFERRGIPADPSQLSHHDWVHYTPLSARLRFRRENRLQTVTLKGRLRTNSGAATMVLLREGYGLSLCPLWIVHKHLVAGRLKAVMTDYETRRAAVYAVYPEGRNLLPRVRLFVEYLVESFARVDWTTIEPEWVAAG